MHLEEEELGEDVDRSLNFIGGLKIPSGLHLLVSLISMGLSMKHAVSFEEIAKKQNLLQQKVQRVLLRRNVFKSLLGKTFVQF